MKRASERRWEGVRRHLSGEGVVGIFAWVWCLAMAKRGIGVHRREE